MQQGDTPFAFGVIADAQYCDANPTGTRYYRESRQKLADCVDAFNQMDLSFAVHLGDFIDRHFESFAQLSPVFDRLKPPHYHVLGNHDFSVTANHLEDVVAALRMPNRYHSFRQHGWRFVVLDGNDLSLYGRPKDSRKYEQAQAIYKKLEQQKVINAQSWNGALGKAQLAWLDSELAESDKNGERVIIFCHFPVFPDNVHNLWNSQQVIQTIQSHQCVAAYMSGHNHAGNYGQKGGVHYVTFPGMVETRDTTAYAVVHVHADRLDIDGFGRTPDRQLAI